MNNYTHKYNHFVSYYWLVKQFGGKKKWKTFYHNGVLFPPEYIPHKIPIIYNNEKVYLSPEAEEIATLYAKCYDTEYVKNKTFNKNFWGDWKKILGKNTIIKSLEDCDFKLIYQHILDNKLLLKNMSKEEKEEKKRIKDKLEEKYKVAIVDGKPQSVGNFRVEPPGIFIGRGCHPKLGRVKRRIYPEDITLNLSKDAPIPETLPNHKWGTIIHDKNVEWLASWKDDITGKTKYVWLGANSDMKAEGDKNKYEKARKLKKIIKKIRSENEINLNNDNIEIKQIATALYFIDALALRVGNEKGEDEADTVGVSSLRVQHIKLLDNNKITLNFLGKDSVPYTNTVEVPNNIYKNLMEFIKNKDLNDPLFDKIDSNDINKYLQKYMKGLTAKVFRTMNASMLFQKELKKIVKKYGDNNNLDINIILDEFNKANAKVAILCNHQKNINKSFDNQIDLLNDKIKNTKLKIKKLKSKKNKKNKSRLEKLKKNLEKYNVKKELKVEMKNVSLGTSKTNYLDPRISISFMKKYNLPIDKIFSKTLIERFKWAFDVNADWEF